MLTENGVANKQIDDCSGNPEIYSQIHLSQWKAWLHISSCLQD